MLHTSPHTGEQWIREAEKQYGGNFLPSTRKRSFRPSGPIFVFYSVRGGAVGGPCLSSTINVQYFSLRQCSFPDDIQNPHGFISFGLAASSIGPPFCFILAHQQLLSFSLHRLGGDHCQSGAYHGRHPRVMGQRVCTGYQQGAGVGRFACYSRLLYNDNSNLYLVNVFFLRIGFAPCTCTIMYLYPFYVYIGLNMLLLASLCMQSLLSSVSTPEDLRCHQEEHSGEYLYISFVLQFEENSDDESFAPPTRQRTEEKLDALMHEVENVNDSLKDIVSLTKNSPFPVALKRILWDTFKSTINHHQATCNCDQML